MYQISKILSYLLYGTFSVWTWHIIITLLFWYVDDIVVIMLSYKYLRGTWNCDWTETLSLNLLSGRVIVKCTWLFFWNECISFLALYAPYKWIVRAQTCWSRLQKWDMNHRNMFIFAKIPLKTSWDSLQPNLKYLIRTS